MLSIIVVTMSAGYTPGACASPFEVDSSGIADGLELKSSFEYRDRGDRQTLIAPKLAIAVPLSLDVEFEVASSYHRVRDGGVKRAGLADTTLELKWRLAEEAPERVAVAVIPQLSVPTGSARHGLGAGHAAVVVPVVMEKHLGGLLVSLQSGYGVGLGGEDPYVPLGVLLLGQPLDTLKLGVELAGEAPANAFSDCELSANVGFKWQATRAVEFHGLIGRTVRSVASDPTYRFKLVAEVHM